MIATKLSRLKISARKALLVLQGVILASAGILPIVISQSASAAVLQLSNREVQSTTARPGPTGTPTLTFEFDTTDKSATVNVKQIEIEFCDAPLGTCTAEDGSSNAGTDKIPVLPGSPSPTLTGWAGTGLTTTRENGDGGGTSNQVKIVITTPADENNKTNLQIAIPGFTNDEQANASYYPRIRLYSDTGTTLEWQGAVAQSTSQTLTINARVAEQLSFCIGTTVTDAIGTNNVTPMVNSGSTNISSCTNADGTTVDLGTVSSSAVNITPVSTGNGSNTNAYAMIQTNAQNGASVAYRAVQESSTGRLHVTGQSCSGSTAFDAGSGSTDQCFGSSTTQTAFSAGSEAFGVAVGGVSCYAVPVAAYSCTYTAGTNKLKPTTTYQGQGTFGSSWAYGTSNGFTWDQSGSAATIATSTTVIANEALLLKFAAGSSVTTPTGQYSTQADFIATPTF